VTLLADDVGLGKTISAGLIVSELMKRNRISKIFVVCPKILIDQWVEELEAKFGIRAYGATGAGLRGSAGRPEPVIVTTYQSAATFLEDGNAAGFDMLILDEAHKVRNLHGSQNAPKMATAVFDALRARAFKYVLMLTATPIQNRLWDIYSLVDCLAVARGHTNPFGTPDQFTARFIADGKQVARRLRPENAAEFRKIVGSYMFRTRRVDAKLAFPEREVRTHPVDATTEERELQSTIAASITRFDALEQVSLLVALMSSPQALAQQLSNMAKKGTAPSDLESRVKALASRVSRPAKTQQLLLIAASLRKQSNEWRMVVFTTRRETQDMIGKVLEEEGISYGFIRGGQPTENRKTIERFRKSQPDIHVVVSTDAGAEGVNLQSGNVLVNYDLPWNPNRLEQRFGRIHRIGQKEVCHLWNLLAKDTREGDVYIQLLHKLEIAREALGDKVFDVLGQLFSGRSLRDLLMDAVRYNQQPERQLQMDLEIEGAVNQEHLRQLLNERALVQQGMDVHMVELLRQQMERAMARRIHPHYVHDFFIEAFRRLGGKVFEREKGRYEITYVPPLLLDHNQQMGFGVPVQARYERICFEKDHVAATPRAELVSPGHPLLEACLSLVLERDGAVLGQGAVLVDERDLGTEPRMLFCLEHGLQDGRRNRHGQQQLISNRLQFLEINRQGEVVIAGSAPYLDYRPLKEGERQQIEGVLSESWLAQDWDQLVITHALTTLVPQHLEEVKGERLERIAKASQEIQSRMQREINLWYRRYEELKLQESAGKQVRLPAQVAKERYELLVARLEKRKVQLALEAQISAKVPILKGGTLVIPVGLLLEASGAAEEAGPDAAARKRVELLAMNAVFEAEKALGRMPRDVSAVRGEGYDIESMDSNGDLFFIEVKGRVAGADSVTLTINEVNRGRNVPQQFRLALVTVTGDQASAPVYVSGIDWGVPGFGDTQITKNLQQLLAAGKRAH
jgi:superfamily II DNA or RNA helicase